MRANSDSVEEPVGENLPVPREDMRMQGRGGRAGGPGDPRLVDAGKRECGGEESG